MMSPRIIVIANPDIIELQSDRATPAAACTITLRLDRSGKAALEGRGVWVGAGGGRGGFWKTGKCWQIMCQYQLMESLRRVLSLFY